MDFIFPGQGEKNEHRKCVTALFDVFNTVCLHQIHAYNLETNYWEEIVTKPHGKIGL